MANTNGPILIIGAGVTGLAIAHGLKKHNIPCIIFERDTSLTSRSRDWNMGLHWGASHLQSLIPAETWRQIQSVQVDPHEPTKALDMLRFLNGADGVEMGAARIDYFYRLVRSKLRALLAERLDIRYGRKLCSLSYSEDGQSATARFEDGTSATGCLIVGADGAKSTVRRLAIMDERYSLPRRLPYAATWATARFTAELALHLRSFHPLYLASVHPAGRFAFFGLQDCPDPADPASWLFFFYISYPCAIEEQDAMASWPQAQLMRHIKTMANEFADPWKSAFEWLPDTHPLWFMGMTDWDPASASNAWHSHGGLVTLAGDAAHVMTYQRGQGLNHSTADAAGVVRGVSEFWQERQEQDAAIAGYEAKMKTRAGMEVRMSTANTEMVHEWEQALQSPLFKQGLDRS